MNLESISFENPHWIINFYYINATVETISTVLSVYLIIFHSTTFDNFRYYLLWFQISCMFTNLLACLFFQPIFLFPAYACYAVGVSWTIFEIPIHTSVLIGINSGGQQACALLACFLRRHFSISKLRKGSQISKLFYIRFVLFLEVLLILTILTALFYKTDRDSRMKTVAEDYPTLVEKFRKLEIFEIYSLKASLIPTLILGSVGILIVAPSFAILTVDMLRTLKQNELHVSKWNLLKHKSAVKCLLAQLFSSTLCILPILVVAIALMIQMKNAQVIAHISLIVFTLHSLLNLIALSTSYPSYRSFIISLFSKSKPTSAGESSRAASFWTSAKIKERRESVLT